MTSRINSKNNDMKVLDYIVSVVKTKGFPPTVREICQSMGIKSTSSVHAILTRLNESGHIVKDASLPRAIKVLDTGKPAEEKAEIRQLRFSGVVEAPVVGKITAGYPLLAEENISEYFPVPESYARGRDVFLLKVSGDSMINAGILNNDLVLVARQNTAVNRDIVVALIDNDATVKTYYKEKNYIRLQPENDFYEPIICMENIMILGKVVGVFRRI